MVALRRNSSISARDCLVDCSWQNAPYETARKDTSVKVLKAARWDMFLLTKTSGKNFDRPLAGGPMISSQGQRSERAIGMILYYYMCAPLRVQIVVWTLYL